MANAFLSSREEFAAEARYPLDVYLCKTCSLVQLLDDGVLGQAFNFGTEQPLSVIKLVDLILRLCDKTKLQPRVHEASHEIPKQHLDCSKVRTRLDWRPNYSLEDRIQETISSYRKHFSS